MTIKRAHKNKENKASNKTKKGGLAIGANVHLQPNID